MRTLLSAALLIALIAGLARGQVRDTLRQFEEQDAVIAVYSEPEQHAALTWALALAQDAAQDDVVRVAAYARLGRWTRSLKSPNDRRRAVVALCAALRARPAAARARFRAAVLDSLAAAAWPLEPGAAEQTRKALAIVSADKTLLARERRQVEELSERFSQTYAAAR